MEALSLDMPFPISSQRFFETIGSHRMATNDGWAYRDKVQTNCSIRFEQKCPERPVHIAITLEGPVHSHEDQRAILEAVVDALIYVHAIPSDTQLEELDVKHVPTIEPRRVRVEVSAG